MGRWIALFVPSLLLAACGANKDSGPEEVELEEDTGVAVDPDGGTDDGGLVFDVSDDMNAGDGFTDGGACATTKAAAIKQPVDVIIVIDQSGSMSDDIANVRANINKLSDNLKKTGLAYRVVMIAGYDSASVRNDGTTYATSASYQVCVPAPLGGATCGAPNTYFRHANVHVESYDALKAVALTYDSTAPTVKWKDFLRPGAAKVIIPITDDNSNYSGTSWLYGLSATDFDNQMLSKPGAPFGTKSKRNYVAYPIIGAPAYPAESPKCGSNAVNTGSEYIALAKLTKGRWFPICLTDFGPVFTEMAKSIATRVACELTIPEPPTGEKIDYNKVNVTYTSSSGGTSEQIKKDDSAPCEAGANGWQYNADNTKILLCGDACKKVQADLSATVVVEFGCGTVTK
ncbi:MAG: VWA domain-containing protein [Deltaproteobacteria bacterium]|nr:VWA domain-containing protein [Deltaproteobacteria bacterium]